MCLINLMCQIHCMIKLNTEGAPLYQRLLIYYGHDFQHYSYWNLSTTVFFISAVRQSIHFTFIETFLSLLYKSYNGQLILPQGGCCFKRFSCIKIILFFQFTSPFSLFPEKKIATSNDRRSESRECDLKGSQWKFSEQVGQVLVRS